MRYKPQLVFSTGTVWNTATTPKTINVTVKAGDTIIVFGIIEGQASSSSDTLAVTGGGLSWSTAVKVNVASYTHVSEQHATATADATFDISIAHTGNTALWYGARALGWRGSDGVGTPVKTNVASGAPSLDVVTGAAASAIMAFSGDWAAVDGASRTWRTINGIIPTAANGLELDYFRDAAHYVLYGAYWDDVGVAGTKTTGVSAPGAQKYSIIAMEIKGTNRTVQQTILKQHLRRASNY